MGPGILSMIRHDSRSLLSVRCLVDVPIVLIHLWIQILETEPSRQLNLAPRPDCAEYSPYVVGEITRCILKYSVSISDRKSVV